MNRGEPPSRPWRFTAAPVRAASFHAPVARCSPATVHFGRRLPGRPPSVAGQCTDVEIALSPADPTAVPWLHLPWTRHGDPGMRSCPVNSAGELTCLRTEVTDGTNSSIRRLRRRPTSPSWRPDLVRTTAVGRRVRHAEHRPVCRSLHIAAFRRADARRHRSGAERLLTNRHRAVASHRLAGRAGAAARSAIRPVTKSAGWSTWWRAGRTARPTRRSPDWWCGSGGGWPSSTPPAIDTIEHAQVVLRSARLDLREFDRRPGEVMLGRDVLDHQLVDVDGKQVVRAADLYLAPVLGRVRLVGVDVSPASLLRRLGPARWRHHPTPDRVIDWAAIQPFGDTEQGEAPEVRLRTTNEGLERLRPGELADLLEELRRPERQRVAGLARPPEEAADALEEMDPEDLTACCCASPSPSGPPTCWRQDGARRGGRRPAGPGGGRAQRAARRACRRPWRPG